MWLKDEDDIPTGAERRDTKRDEEQAAVGKDTETDPERREGSKP